MGQLLDVRNNFNLEFYANISIRGQTVGWAGMIRVDGIAYSWMGEPGPQLVTQTAFEYTSTKSIFTLNAGSKVELKVTFLSPITPSDLQRQSLISSYLNVDVRSLDGAIHDVQLYTDISAGEIFRIKY